MPTLPTPQPFSLTSVVNSHGWIQLAPFRKDPTGDGFSFIDRLSTGKVLDLHIRTTPAGLAIETATDLTLTEQDQVCQHLTWMLGLNQDFTEFYALAAAEPELAHVVTQVKGRILRSPTFFEDVLKTILTTNTLWAATIRMNKNLVAQFGEPLPTDPEQRAFPTPARLAAGSEETLRTATRLGYRAPYVLELARQVDSGALDIESFKDSDLPTPELRKRLLAIKGIGAYAAANLLMLLGRYDAIPIDSWALKMVSQTFHAGAPIGKAEVEAAFERWGKWKGLVYWLWEWKRGDLGSGN